MKSTMNEFKQRTQKYPCLKRWLNGDTIVLFTAPGKGTVVHVSSHSHFADDSLGKYRIDWIDSSFKPFDGSVILTDSETADARIS